jgi:hypothetical protein
VEIDGMTITRLCRALMAALLLGAASCDGAECKCRGGKVPDAAVGNSDGSVTSLRDASIADELIKSESFWSAFRIDGEWAEYQPTLVALAEHADLVAIGRVTDMMEPITTQGDAPEDVVTEARLVVQVDRSASGTVSVGDTVVLTMVSKGRLTEAEQARLKDLLPSTSMLVMLRKRENGTYRVVNGYALWAATTRSALDCPIEAYPETCATMLAEAGAGSSLAALASRVGL